MPTIAVCDLLPKLKTSEDDQGELQKLARAEPFAMAILVGGPLLNDDCAGMPTDCRLLEAVDQLSETEEPVRDELEDEALGRGCYLCAT